MVRKKILAISGSTRRSSSNESILHAISNLYSAIVEIEIYDQIDQLPHFNPDYDNDEKLPQEVKRFRRMIEEADGILICTPEYVFSIPGSLKNALEWTVSTVVFSYKPCAFIVASASGEMAFESLNLIMNTLTQEPVPEQSKLLIQGVRSKITGNGIISDEKLLNDIKSVIDSLIKQMQEKSGQN